MLEVKLRGGFSDRNNIDMENTIMQQEDLDERTRVAIVNLVAIVFKNFGQLAHSPRGQRFIKDFLAKVYLQEIDQNSFYDEREILKIVSETIKWDTYDKVFTVLEFLVDGFTKLGIENLEEYFNKVFRDEYVGYRFAGGFLCKITNDTEIASIKNSANTKYDSVNSHMRKALALISNRENPDYENCIKESISAVEAIITLILGEKGTLGELLSKFEKSDLKIHPAMKGAFQKLYGYTSDAGGIRHSNNIGGKASTFEEAQFMLVTCSAFVNYLIGLCKE